MLRLLARHLEVVNSGSYDQRPTIIITTTDLEDLLLWRKPIEGGLFFA